MSSPVLIEKTSTVDGALVYFGPIDPESKRQLAIPVTFERQISDQVRGLTLTITCQFVGDKVEVTRLNISADRLGTISSRTIAQLGIPGLIREVVKAVTPSWEFWLGSGNEDDHLDVSKTNYAYLAQVYWLEHISQGTPRQTLMSMLKMPRSTCNVLLRKIKNDFGLPVAG